MACGDGMGAALTIPASLSIVNDVFRDPAERAKAIGAWGGTIGLGIAIGPIAGGLLLSRFWWGSIFLVNVPVVIVGFLGALLLVPDSKNPVAQRPDPAGAVLSIAGLGLLLWAIIEAPTEGWTSGLVIGIGLASLVVLGSFIAWEAHSSHAMLPLHLFSNRRFSIAAAGEMLGPSASSERCSYRHSSSSSTLATRPCKREHASCRSLACWLSLPRCPLPSSRSLGSN